MYFISLHWCLCFFSISTSGGRAGVITLYENINFKGTTNNIRINEMQRECANLSTDWQKRASSINIRGVCVDMYSEMNCQGQKHIRLYTGNEYHKNLLKWDFDDELTSLQACEIIINERNYKREGDTVTIIDAKENILLLNVPSCKNLPLFWRNHAVKTKTSGRCYNYYSALNCMGMKILIDETDIVDFRQWNFEYATNSIDPCPKNITIARPFVTNKNVSSTSTSSGNLVTSDGTQPDKGFSGDTIMILVSVAVVVVILILLFIGGITVFFIYFRRKIDSPPNSEAEAAEVLYECLSKQCITNFMQGNPSVYQKVCFENTDAIYIAQIMPYDAETYEIPLEYLEIDWQSTLGSGEYGTVSKAKVAGPNFPEPKQVAVKTVKAGAEPGYVKALLEELKIMIYLNGSKANYVQHRNIVNLIGACTQNLTKLEPYIVLELCTQGSLFDYLRKHRRRFSNLVNNGQLIKLNDYSEREYSNIDSHQSRVNTNDLLKWSIGIAEGMEFLSRKKVIHGDLAARNVLLDDQLNVKISDFGLSRKLYQYTIYVKSNQTLLPWRWLAIESLNDLSFSTQSDVWAYGITLHEIFTLGETPYPGVMFSPQFLSHIKDGYRMSIPKYAPTVLYTLMIKCWHELLEERPSFSEIRQEILNILEE